MAQFFYDGQIRRYVIQIMRLVSNFVVKHGDGTLHRIPVMYGDIDRQVASIINQNSENYLSSAPRIAVYITDLQLDRDRLSDSTYVGKVHLRERDIIDNPDGNDLYGWRQGQNYTVERLMPTPYRLKLKVDIWAANTDQKFQILEQILMLFNPSLEIQTTDNFVDWTSLSVVDLDDIIFTSNTVPVGTNVNIDIASLSLSTPIWISPPAKVKRLGIITNIIANVFGNITEGWPDYAEGLGVDMNNGEKGLTDLLFSNKVAVGNYDIIVSENTVKITSNITGQMTLSWEGILNNYPGKYVPGLLKIYLRQVDGSEVIGYGETDPFDDSSLIIKEWDQDTFPTNDTIPGPARAPAAYGSFDAIVNPTSKKPDASRVAGTRYLLVENIGGGIRETLINNTSINLINTEIEFDKVNDYRIFVNNIEVNSTPVNKDGLLCIQTNSIIPIKSTISYELYVNEDGPDAWKNSDGSDFIADANDIIEWDGHQWHVVFSAKQSRDRIVYQTNIFTLVQYKWNGVSWTKSFDGEYRRGEWRIQL